MSNIHLEVKLEGLHQIASQNIHLLMLEVKLTEIHAFMSACINNIICNMLRLDAKLQLK